MLNVISRCGSYLSIGLLTVLLAPVSACGGGDDGPKLTSEQLEECRDPSNSDELIEAAEELGIQFSEEFEIGIDDLFDEWDGDFGATYRRFQKDRSDLVRTQPWFEEACAEDTWPIVRDEELRKLVEKRDAGDLTETEFQEQAEEIFNKYDPD